MTAGSKPRIEGRGYRAAIRWFPQSELAIRRLINQSETFRDICEELAEAEMVLSTVSAESREVYEARKQEWQELVDRLVGEVATSLRGAKRDPASQDHRPPGAKEEEQR